MLQSRAQPSPLPYTGVSGRRSAWVRRKKERQQQDGAEEEKRERERTLGQQGRKQRVRQERRANQVRSSLTLIATRPASTALFTDHERR